MLSRPRTHLLALALASVSFSAALIAADKPFNAEEAIKNRQGNFEQIGEAFKTIRDEVRARDADMEAIIKSATTINTHAQNIPTWFPAGTGPEAGVETEALAKIWEDNAGFTAAAKRLADASTSFLALANSGDASKVAGGIPDLGGACKNCHDNYRAD